MSILYAEFGPHGLTKISTRAARLRFLRLPLVLVRIPSRSVNSVKGFVVLTGEVSDAGSTADSQVDVCVLQGRDCRPHVLIRIKILTATGFKVQLLHGLPVRICRHQILMASFAALIPNSPDLLLTVCLDARLFAPLVI
jgi:hypothetical protein